MTTSHPDDADVPGDVPTRPEETKNDITTTSKKATTADVRRENGRMRKGNVWMTVVILVGIFAIMLTLAYQAESDKVKNALDWTKTLVGILVTAAGVGVSAISLADAESKNRLLGAGPGVVGVLAGSTLLGVGDWAAPVALGVTGVAAAVVYALKQ